MTERTVILVLQGGGALGAYHIGAFQALQEAGYAPDWIAGISIGAVNAAILAGNPPEDQLGKLEAFWHDISRPDGWGSLLAAPTRTLFNAGSNAETLLAGQPNFFTPRVPGPYLSPPGTAAATSFYDTAPLRATLLRLVDFGRINAAPVRLSLGATDVQTGQLVFFDNVTPKRTLTPEHVMASGALPPGFPPVAVDGGVYWDGGVVSNTPLEAVSADEPRGSTLVFMLDLWSASGPPPATIEEVQWRQKQIQYASRTPQSIQAAAAKLRRPDDARMDIVHVVYHPAVGQIPNSDAEFSRPSLAERRQAGYADLQHALAAAPWATGAQSTPVVVHTISRGHVKSSPLSGEGGAARGSAGSFSP